MRYPEAVHRLHPERLHDLVQQLVVLKVDVIEAVDQAQDVVHTRVEGNVRSFISAPIYTLTWKYISPGPQIAHWEDGPRVCRCSAYEDQVATSRCEREHPGRGGAETPGASLSQPSPSWSWQNNRMRI
jgi:hypothetical protein